MQVTRGEPDGAGPDLTGTALPPSVSHAPRETGTPLADGPGGRQGRLESDHQLMMNWNWAACGTEPGNGWSRTAVCCSSNHVAGLEPTKLSQKPGDRVLTAR